MLAATVFVTAEKPPGAYHNSSLPVRDETRATITLNPAECLPRFRLMHSLLWALAIMKDDALPISATALAVGASSLYFQKFRFTRGEGRFGR